MARTIQEIYDDIIAEKETFTSLDSLVPNPDTSQTFLSNLTSTSKVAVWRLMFWVVAVAIFTFENILDTHTAEIEARALELIPGTLRWYADKSKEFQNGYELEWDGDSYVYSDTTSQDAVDSKIITQAAAIESGSNLIIKVAKGTVPSLSALSTSEKASFTSYINDIKFAGTFTTIISDSPDDLKLAITIYYDPQVIQIISGSPDRGQSITDSTYPVEVAINTYIQSIPFNSKLRIIDLVDALQVVDGVNNVVIDSADARYGVIPYTDILGTTPQEYTANAGYLDMATNFDVDGYYNYPTNTIPTITYISS